VAKRLREKGKPNKLVIIAIANAVLRNGTPWHHQPGI
jgi:hypothetical protein